MKHVETLLKAVTDRLEDLARGKAVVGETISVGERHVIPLCEISMGMGAGGGTGRAEDEGRDIGEGMGGGTGGGAKVQPVAFVIVDGAKVSLKTLDA